MRILKLTPKVEKRLLRSRQQRDAEADKVAAEIICDIRGRGDTALFAWTQKLDGIDLRRERLWITAQEMRSARKKVGGDFLKAVAHAARNIRRVAAKQL